MVDENSMPSTTIKSRRCIIVAALYPSPTRFVEGTLEAEGEVVPSVTALACLVVLGGALDIEL